MAMLKSTNKQFSKPVFAYEWGTCVNLEMQTWVMDIQQNMLCTQYKRLNGTYNNGFIHLTTHIAMYKERDKL